MILGTSPSITVNHPKKLAYKMRGWCPWSSVKVDEGEPGDAEG